MYISLYGACEELNVHLQPDVVLLKSTYLSLSTVHQVSLTNKSDVPLKYCWTTWPSLQEEALSLLRWPMILHRQPTTMIFIVFSKHELLKPSLFLCMHESSEVFFSLPQHEFPEIAQVSLSLSTSFSSHLVFFSHSDPPYFSLFLFIYFFASYFSSCVLFLKGELSTQAKGGGREGSVASSVRGWPDSGPWPHAAVQGPAGTQGPSCAGQPPGLLTKLRNCGTSGETEPQRL